MKVIRPWGSYTVLGEGQNFKVKLIEMAPYKRLSLQRHKLRSEHWIIVEGKARVINENHTHNLKKNDSIFISKMSLHRLENFTDIPLKIIEVQCGSYLEEDDIERFQDDHGRVSVINEK